MSIRPRAQNAAVTPAALVGLFVAVAASALVSVSYPVELEITLYVAALILLGRLRCVPLWAAALLPLAAVAISIPATAQAGLLLGPPAIVIAMRVYDLRAKTSLVCAVIVGGYFAITQIGATSASDTSVLNVFVRYCAVGLFLGIPGARRVRATSDLPRRKASGRQSDLTLAAFVLAVSVLSLVVAWPRGATSQSASVNYSSTTGLRPSGWADSPNEFGALLVVVGVVVLAGALSGTGGARYRLFMLGASALVVLGTQTRSALIALAVGVVTVWLTTFRSATTRQRVLGGIVLVMGAVALSVVLIAGLGGRDLLGRDDDGSATYRRAVVAVLWDRIRSGYVGFSGSGFYNGATVRPNELFQGLQTVDGSLYYLLAAGGIFAVVILLAAIILAAVRAFAGGSVVVALIACYFTIAIFENSIAWPKATLLFAVGAVILEGRDETLTDR